MKDCTPFEKIAPSFWWALGRDINDHRFSHHELGPIGYLKSQSQAELVSKS
jgi:hypothetical protein